MGSVKVSHADRVTYAYGYARDRGMAPNFAQAFAEWFATHWPSDSEYTAYDAWRAAREAQA